MVSPSITPDPPQPLLGMHLGVRRMGPLALVGVLMSLSGATPASEDAVHSLRVAELSEVEHSVDVTFEAGAATMVVKRTVYNPGEEFDQTTFEIRLPDEAVATGLRTLGLKDGRPHWYPGELLEAEEAARRYKELTGIGGYHPKDPALLSWRSQGYLALQVFPCPPRERKSVEYTVQMPTRYTRGAHLLSLEPFGTPDRPADLRLSPQQRGGKVFLGDREIAPGSRIPWGEGSLELGYVQTSPEQFGLTLARTQTGEGRMVQRVDVRLGRLSTVPKRLDIVLIADRSVSIHGPYRDGLLRALRGYLRSAPHAAVELVTFARTARSESAGFLPANHLDAMLATLDIPAENGSNIEAALHLAGDLLRARSPGPERRIVVLTDGLTSSRVTPERLRGLAVGTSALVHVGVMRSVGEPELTFAPDEPWGRATEPTGGLVWRVSVPDESADIASSMQVFEEWMRPVRLHDVRIGISTEVPLVVGSTLDEGEEFSNLDLVEETHEPLFLRGRLWARPVSHGAAVDEQSSTRWAGLVFGSPLVHSLSDSEILTLAMKGRAVSPMTSYLAIEPGVRPSTEGIDWLSGQGVGLGGFGRGSSLRMGASRSSFPDPEGYLRDLVKKHWERCGGSGAAGVDFETTVDEIVAIDNVSGIENDDHVAEKCLEEALWLEVLPRSFNESFASYAVVAH